MKRFLRSLTWHTIIVVLGFSFVASVAFSQATDASNNANISVYPEPYQLSDLVFRTPDGKIVSLKDYKGKVVILHFWSINCPACRIEEPLLVQLKQTMAGAGLEILAVNFVDSSQAIANYVATRRPPFPILQKSMNGFDLKVVKMGDKTTAFVVNPAKEAILEVPGFPTNYIVDCRGGVVGYSVGPARWDSTYALSLLQRLLDQRKACAGGIFENTPKRISFRQPLS